MSSPFAAIVNIFYARELHQSDAKKLSIFARLPTIAWIRTHSATNSPRGGIRKRRSGKTRETWHKFCIGSLLSPARQSPICEPKRRLAWKTQTHRNVSRLFSSAFGVAVSRAPVLNDDNFMWVLFKREKKMCYILLHNVFRVSND